MTPEDTLSDRLRRLANDLDVHNAASPDVALIRVAFVDRSGRIVYVTTVNADRGAETSFTIPGSALLDVREIRTMVLTSTTPAKVWPGLHESGDDQ